MLGRLAFTLGAAALTPSKPARQVPHRPPTGLGGCITVLGIVGCVTVFVIGNATHTWTVLWFITVPLICAAIIGLGQLTSAAGRQHRMEAAVRNLPDPKPEIMTVSAMRQRAEQIKRLARVHELIIVSCPMCGSGYGVSCAVKPGVTHYLLDAEREIFVHGLRIQKGIEKGYVNMNDLIAQFNGNVPESLLASLL
jgi:hypothetical protein